MSALGDQMRYLSGVADGWQPIPPPPVQPAQRVLMGYFGCNDTQIDETADHVSVLHETFWSDLPAAIARIKRANMATIITVDRELFANGRYIGAAASQAALRAKFNTMSDAGALANVAALYTCDEPEKQGISDADIRNAHKYLRWVMDQYHGLKGKPLAIVYSQDENYPALDDADLVGFDAYGERGAIFSNGRYDRFKAKLRAGQKTILVPGGCNSNDGTLWRADPADFLKAAAGPEVALILAFIWIDQWAGNQHNVGIRSNGMADAYRVLGQTIKGVTA